MFIHKLAIVVCATGFVIQDETDDEAEPFPIAGFGIGQLPDALDYMRASIEIEAEARAEDARLYKEAHDAQQARAAQAARGLGNVVAGPGFKAAPALEDPFAVQPPPTAREIVDEVNELALTLLRARGRGAPLAFEFHKVRPGQGQEREHEAWCTAVTCYEQITGRVVVDAVEALRVEELQAEARIRMEADLRALQP